MRYHLISSQSLNLGGHRGTTDDIAAIPFHPSPSSAALRESPNSIPVHSLMLSSNLFFCLPLLLAPFTVPCRIVFIMPEDREMWPYQLSFCFFTKVRRSSRTPVTFCCKPPLLSNDLCRKCSEVSYSISSQRLRSFSRFGMRYGMQQWTDSRARTWTHKPKAICPLNFFEVGDIKISDTYREQGCKGQILGKIQIFGKRCIIFFVFHSNTKNTYTFWNF